MKPTYREVMLTIANEYISKANSLAATSTSNTQVAVVNSYRRDAEFIRAMIEGHVPPHLEQEYIRVSGELLKQQDPEWGEYLRLKEKFKDAG